MTRPEFTDRVRHTCGKQLPIPGAGHTAQRHLCLLEVAREDLSLARIVEAHFDAVAILADANREPVYDALYGVWASEIPGKSLTLSETSNGFLINGAKSFCSGAGLIDHALVTVAAPDPFLIDIDLHTHADTLSIDTSAWKPAAFAQTNTATVTFHDTPVSRDAILGQRGWYLTRPGFWHGAIGPASCWAGGALGLVDYARNQSRSDPHTLAHLGALEADAYALCSVLTTSGNEIDAAPNDIRAAHIRALTVRHLVEQHATSILTHLGRAYGPHPLVFDEPISQRTQELTIYLRQSHAERDLAALGELVRLSS